MNFASGQNKDIKEIQMPKINIKKNSSHDMDSTYTKIKDVLENDSDLKKLDSNYSCTCIDAEKSITAKGKTFKAEVNIESNGSQSLVKIVVDLPLMFAPFKGAVEKTLSRKLEKALG